MTAYVSSSPSAQNLHRRGCRQRDWQPDSSTAQLDVSASCAAGEVDLLLRWRMHRRCFLGMIPPYAYWHFARSASSSLPLFCPRFFGWLWARGRACDRPSPTRRLFATFICGFDFPLNNTGRSKFQGARRNWVRLENVEKLQCRNEEFQNWLGAQLASPENPGFNVNLQLSWRHLKDGPFSCTFNRNTLRTRPICT